MKKCMVVLLLLLSSCYAVPVLSHDIYMSIKRPDMPSVSCCGDMATGGDCRPAELTTKNDKTYIDGFEWDQTKIVPSPDNRYHICEKGGNIYCILAPPGT